MQQAARVSDTTAFFNLAGIGQPGKLVESGPTETIFTSPKERATEDYISGRWLTDRRGWGPSVERVYDRGVITHIVMMKLHDSDDRVEAATRLRDMEGRIPELLSLEGAHRRPRPARRIRPGAALPHTPTRPGCWRTWSIPSTRAAGLAAAAPGRSRGGRRAMSRITIVEVGPRDGLQNEAVVVDTDTKVEFIARCVAAGVQRIEAASLVNPKRVPQMADGEAVLAQLPPDAASYIGLVLNGDSTGRWTPRWTRSTLVVMVTDTFSLKNQGMTTAGGHRSCGGHRATRESRRAARERHSVGVLWLSLRGGRSTWPD